MSDLTDVQLMQRVQAGNTRAFAVLFERHRARVFGFLLRMLAGDRQQAEDLLQDVFVKVYEARDYYEPRAAFTTWLFTLARNHALNYLKSRRFRNAQVTQALDDERAPGAVSGPAATPAEVLGERERLEGAIGRLPEDLREVFLLRAVHGYSTDEVALLVSAPAATVRTHFFRARRRLQEVLSPLTAREEDV